LGKGLIPCPLLLAVLSATGSLLWPRKALTNPWDDVFYIVLWSRPPLVDTFNAVSLRLLRDVVRKGDWSMFTLLASVFVHITFSDAQLTLYSSRMMGEA
jgi:hypothetical protein